jgi:hypothetical protein
VRVRITHLDGKLPNLALMKLAHWHRAQGDDVYFTHSATRLLFETDYDRVYGSTIFRFTRANYERFRQEFPNAIVGGTGAYPDTPLNVTVEAFLGIQEYEQYDYSLYPSFTASLGFTQRGCRLACAFCDVARKEGRPRDVNTIPQIWRGAPFPKQLHLLDNDFFGGPHWRKRVAEIHDGAFKVSFNQGLNIRLINDEAAEVIASLPLFDDQFKRRRIYTAWDNLGDEAIFTRGIDRLVRYGTRPNDVFVYMLVGFRQDETLDDVLYRFDRLVQMGCRPYPMVFDNCNSELRRLQRWAVMGAYKKCAFKDYDQPAYDNSFRRDRPLSEPLPFEDAQEPTAIARIA